MKFIHCADLHIDSKIKTLPSDKSKIRREEIIRTFERLTDYAAENGVTAVIIAGDMFDDSGASEKAKNRVFAAIKAHPETDYLYLAGNHDESCFFSRENLPENFKTFGERWTSFRYGGVCVTGVSARGENFDPVYGALDLSAKDVNIVAMHGQVAGYKSEERAELISLPLLTDKNVDYLALGHIHFYSANKLDERGIYAYSGCLDGRGFDETGKKGFVLLEIPNDANGTCDINDAVGFGGTAEGSGADSAGDVATSGELRRNAVKAEFVPFSSREFFEVELSVTGEADWFDFRERALKKLKADYPAESLVKVIFTGEHKPDFEIDKEAFAARLNEMFFFGKVYDKTTLEISDEDFKNDKSVRGEFVRAVWNSKLPDDKKTAVLMLGLNALKGEDIR